MKKLIFALLTMFASAAFAADSTYILTYPTTIDFYQDNDTDTTDGEQRIMRLARSAITFDQAATFTGALTLSSTLAVTSTLDVTGIATFDDAGVEMAVPVAALDVIRFCGNGPNATTTTYIGPVLLDDTEADLAFGGAGCDALDNTTEATADNPWHASFAFKPVAMVCTSTCGTDDTMTLQLRDDAASVTGMTCDITLAGAAAQCIVRDSTPATVAANSAIAVSAVNDTDDDCSAGDVECLVYITF